MSLTGLKETTAKERRIFRIRQPHTKEITKKEKRRRDSNKSFAKMCEGRKEKNPVRGKMMKLNLIRSNKF